MRTRDLLALGLLVVMIALERMASSAMYSVLTADMVQRGSAYTEVGSTYAMLSGVSLAGMILGAVLARWIGPRAVTAAGTTLAAAGYFLLASRAPLTSSAGVVLFGAGMFWPCVYAAAAEVLAWNDESPAAPGPHRFSAVAAFLGALMLAGDIGGSVGPYVLGPVHDQAFPRLYRASGVSASLAALLAAASTALALAERRARRAAAAAGPYRAHEAKAESTAARPLTVLWGVLILLGVHVVYTAGTSMATPPPALRTSSDVVWLYMMMPLARVAATIPVLVVLVLAAVQRWTRPPLLLQGVGLVIVAIGLGVIALGNSTSATWYGAGAALIGIGEAAAWPVPLAYAAIAVRGRAASLVVAGWMVVGSIVGRFAPPLTAEDATREAGLGIGALLCLGAGMALLRLGRALHGRYFDPPVSAG